ncbi:MAG TPA: SHOCT domain-containing protein [Actinomycetota bacterium]
MLILWSGLAALIVFLVRASGGRPSQGEDRHQRSEAREILAERFARGEVSEEEFEQRTRVLRRGGRSSSSRGGGRQR